MSGKEQDFLSRWSARKRDAAGAAPEVEAVAPPETAPEIAPGAPSKLSPEEQTEADRTLLDALGLKHPGDLRPGDDVKGFMQAAVPDRLRRLALRQLWRGNPVLANLDELVDYGQDFTDSAMVVENMQTLYQVGKGMIRKVEALPENLAEDMTEDLAEDLTDHNEPTAGEPDPAPTPDEHEPQQVDEDTRDLLVEAREPEPETVQQEDDHNEASLPPPQPRRMTFRFES